MTAKEKARAKRDDAQRRSREADDEEDDGADDVDAIGDVLRIAQPRGARAAAQQIVDDAAIQRLIQRVGGGEAHGAIRALLDENHRYREAIRRYKEVNGELLEENQTLKTQVDGFKKHVEDAEKLEALVTEVTTLRGFKKEKEYETVVDDAATTLGWNKNVLKMLAKANGWVLEVKTIDVPKEGGADGEVVRKKAAFFRRADAKEGEEPHPLAKHVEETLPDILPALKAEAAQGGNGKGTTGSTTGAAGGGTPAPRKGGVTYPPQPTGGTAPKVDVVGRELGGRYQLPSQRRKAESTTE
jgi:hypothetical protein